MKRLFIINENAAQRISFYLLAAFVLALPFDFFYSEIILACFALHTLIHSSAASFKKIRSWPVLLLSAVFLLNIAGLMYSPDKQEAINITTRQLAILLLPLLFAMNELDIIKYTVQLVCLLGCSCTFAVLYLYGNAIAVIKQTHQPFSVLFSSAFMNHNFSLPLNIHATYFSLYCTFGLLAFIVLIKNEKQFVYRFIYGFCILVLTAGMLQLSSRAVFIGFLVVVNGVLPFVLFNGKKRWMAFIAVTLLSVVAVFSIIQLDAFRERFISGLENDLSSQNKVFESVEPRWVRWNAVIDLIKKSPVVGYGSGAEKMVLQDQFYQKKLYVAYLNELNAHGEYLSVCIRTGIVGLLLLLGVLFYGFRIAIKKSDALFLFFLILISIVFVAENVLDTNKGIFFYSFYLSLFVMGHAKHDNKMTNT